MKIAKNKTATIIIALILMISMSASMLLIPNNTASAHTPAYQITTYAAVTIQPDPIGVGQSGLGYAFLRNAPLAGSAIENSYRNHNYTVYIVAPSGNTTILHWDTVVDTTGVQFFRFTPTETGQYNITFVYGGEVLNQTKAPDGTYWFDTPTATSVGDIWLPSTATCTLTVNQLPVTQYPESYPLPTTYWTRPIYGENNYWYTISSDWFGVGTPALSDVSYGTITTLGGSQSAIQRYPGDAIGSLTSHVMWTKALQEGGVTGDNRYLTQGDTYFEGSAYNNRYINPIIMYGMLFYRAPISFSGVSSGDSMCVDLRTGAVIWDRTDLPSISFGYTFDVQSPDQHGVYPAFLCTSNFAQVYDMWTGTSVFNVTGSASGSSVLGPQGEWLKYNLFSNTTNGYFLTIWNSSKMFNGEGFQPGTTGLSPTADTNTYTSVNTWTFVNDTQYINNVKTVVSENVTTHTTVTAVNATLSKRYEVLNSTLDNGVAVQNLTLPWRNAMTTTPTVLAVKYNDYMICRNGSYPSLSGVTQNDSGVVHLQLANWTYFKVDVNRASATFGQVLWWSPTISHPQNETITWGGFDPISQVVFEVSKETQNIWGYGTDNTHAGALIWTTNSVNAEQQQNITVLDYFGMPMYPYYATQPAYGNVYCLAYGGILYCYNLTTGIRTWSNGNGETPGNNTDAGVGRGYYPQLLQAVGNGVIYTVASQHTIITPIYKGQMARAINATDGTEIWQLSDYTGEFSGTSYAMADGYCNWFNGYDNNIYTVGQGPSSLTVSAPDTAVPSGQALVIKGTVYDVSAGTKQAQQAADFPNGVPCVADKSMTDWMGYVYQQKPLPTNFTGVDVTVLVTDANGNTRPIGTTQTDATGAYHIIWTPDISGNYQVTANFAGTHGYWPSTATTAFTVAQAAQTSAPPTQQPASLADQYVLPIGIAIIVVVIVVGAVLALLTLRKRP